MLFHKQTLVADFLYRLFELYANHKAATANFLDSVDFLQFRKQIVANFCGVFNQVLFGDDVEHGAGSGASQMVATEGCSQLSHNGCEERRNDDTSHWQTVADAFCHSHNVGFDAGILVGEEFAAPSVTRLYLVENQHGIGCGAGFAQVAHKLVVGHLNAANALNAFNYHRRIDAFLKFGTHCGGVVQIDESNFKSFIYRGNVLWNISNSDGCRCASVERVTESQHLVAAVVERRQFECVLIGFGARVYQEK